MKKLFVIVGLLIIVVILGSVRDRLAMRSESGEVEKQAPVEVKSEEDVHYHSGFIVYYEGGRVDFTDWRYMHIEPCGEEHEEGPEAEQEEKAHLHDEVGDVVHVHRNGAVWRDLFVNIGYEMDEGVVGYVNGQTVENILDKPIVADESVMFVVGSEEGVDLSEEITTERIREVEAMSESCGE